MFGRSAASRSSSRRQARRQAKRHYRPLLEVLEDRVVPTVWTVTTTAASGAGSLFQAVKNANADTSPAIIEFDPTVFANPQTITLAASLVLSNTSESIAIQGPTTAAVTISGNQQGGATIQDFIVDTGVTATIQNLTIADGSGGSSDGGGLSILGGTVTIDHCTISNNIAYSGGGINVKVGNLLLEDSTIEDNTTPATGYGSGAGLNVQGGAVTVIACLFTQNTSKGINGGTGGAVYAGGGVTTVVDSTLTANTAAAQGQYGGYGGAVASTGGNTAVYLVGCTITGNTAGAGSNSGAAGGVYTSYYYALTLRNNVIWNNTAPTYPDLEAGSYDVPTIDYNLVGSGTGNPANGAGNILGVPTSTAILGALGNNGGPTQSMLPVANSLPVAAAGNVTATNAAISSATVSAISVANGFVFAASSLTPNLSFVTQPSDAGAGAPLGAVTVASAAIDFNEFIEIGDEQMQVVGLTLNANGTATLYVARGVNGTTATSHAANAPIYLVSDQRGAVVNPGMPPAVDIGAVQSAASTPPSSGGTLSMSLSSGTLEGTTTAVTNALGQAVFNNLSVPVAGTYQLELEGMIASNSFTVTAGTYPIVSAVSPAAGSAGTTVTISGSNFANASGVFFGGTSATSFTVNSPTQITATAPAGSASTDITVTTPVGTSATSLADQFTYAPVVTAVGPNTGSSSGGTSVTITGNNFTGATAVLFGGTAAANFTVSSATQITATVPAGFGVVDVSVLTGSGTSATSSADNFTYLAAPTVWLVTNTLASGAGSLFQAVQNADRDTTGPSTISFDPTVFATAQSITLAASLLLSNTAQPILIQGPTTATVTVNGNKANGSAIQDFIVDTGVMATIQNLTIAGGNAFPLNGGGCTILGGTVTIDHCTITNNAAYSGGGINVSAGNLLLEDSTISLNTTPITGYGTGAGLNVQGGAVTIVACLFTQNTSNGINGGTGGAIYTAAGVTTVVDSTLTGNTAATQSAYAGNGGAVACEGAEGSGTTVNLVDCTITGNTTDGGYNGGAGGGIYTNYYVAVNLLNDVIWNNTAVTYPDLDAASYIAATVNYTLIGSGTGNPANGAGNILGVPTSTAILGALGNNGGPTQSMLPGANSLPVAAAGNVTATNAAISSATVATISVANGYVFAASSLTPNLSFVSQPSNAVAGAPLAAITVASAAINEFIQIDDEQMQIVGLTLNANGTATLYVARGVNGTTATSHAANAPIYLVSDQRGAVVNPGMPPAVDIGAVQSAASTPPSSGGTLSMSLSSGTLEGTTTAVTNALGQAVFNNLSVPVAGTYQLELEGMIASNSFTVTAGTYPIVSAVSPAAGSAGTTVTISGSNFANASGVFFGGTSATSFTVNSPTQITATAPAGSASTDITVTTPVGTSATSLADQFTYAPVVTAVGPNTGSSSGGTSVTITGNNFTGATAVLFGGTAAANFTVNSATQITATVPAGFGVVDVSVLTGSGTSATSSADNFTYLAAPTVWLVTNTLASGAGSLFQAVQNADRDTTGPSTISFDPTVFATAQSITLAASLLLSNTAQPILIQGPTTATVTVNGNKANGSAIQDFIVDTGVTATIQNLTISGGNAFPLDGGGCSILGGTVTIDHCTLSDNSAYSGGGINVSAGNVLLEDSTISSNMTPITGRGTGAGLDVGGGAVTVLACLFTQNTSNGINGGSGGAIYVGDGLTTVVDSTFTGNTAAAWDAYSGNGGAVACFAASGSNTTVNLINCTITGNTTDAGYVGGAGGGVYESYYATLNLLNNVIWNNTAPTDPDFDAAGYTSPTVNYTLIGSGAGIPNNGVGNILNVPTSTALLGALGSNGGPTQSMVPVANSLLVDNGGNVTATNAAISSATGTTIGVANGSVFAASSLTPQYFFVTQPTNTTPGVVLPPVTVQLINLIDFNEYIQVDAEQMRVLGLTVNANGTATLNVQRGVNGTTAATHAANAPIYLVSDQRGEVVNQGTPPPVDIGAVQSSANTTPDAGFALSMGISSGTLDGTTTAVTNALGQAVFSDLSVPAAGTYQLELQGTIASNWFTVDPTLTITTNSLPDGIVDQGYSQTITATGGTGSYTFAVTAGALPSRP